MKSAQTMRIRLRGAVRGLAVITAMLTMGACVGSSRPLVAPRTTVAPYASLDGEPLWAVVPLRNESGASFVDEFEVSDAVVRAAEQVKGLRCLPLNRTIEAMRAMGLHDGVASPAEARQLARVMGVDGVVVGSITAYDPYNPPTLGISLAYLPVRTSSASAIDPRQLSRATRGGETDGLATGDAPRASASVLFDGRGHDTLLRLEDFARGRVETDGPEDWRLYLMSMDLYTGFVAHHAVRALIDEEWIRLARTGRGRETGG